MTLLKPISFASKLSIVAFLFDIVFFKLIMTSWNDFKSPINVKFESSTFKIFENDWRFDNRWQMFDLLPSLLNCFFDERFVLRNSNVVLSSYSKQMSKLTYRSMSEALSACILSISSFLSFSSALSNLISSLSLDVRSFSFASFRISSSMNAVSSVSTSLTFGVRLFLLMLSSIS